MPDLRLRSDVPASDQRTLVDPAELIFFHELTPDKFFQEAECLGIPQEQLQDHDVRERVFHACLIAYRAQTARALAAELELSITEEQARAIARNSLVPDVLTDPAPLDGDERAVAEELYFQAIRAATARQGDAISDRLARAGAKKMIRRGERGLTTLRKLSQAVGCLIVLMAVLGLGAGLTLLSLALITATGQPSF